jgi:acyl-CoA hydrolase/ribosomal protein S18 acetylase RimI-like enzyme
MVDRRGANLDRLRERYPEKFIPEGEIFSRIRRGNSIFIGTACGEPQHLVNALVDFVESSPTSIYDAEVIHVWTLGVAPYVEEKFKKNFRHNSFFISDNSREAVNQGLADYTPIFLSEVPDLFKRGIIDIDVALIQLSAPDHHGNMSLGISVDIVKSAVENASLVIAQVNSNMPRVHGDTFVNVEQVDFMVPYDEPLIEYSPEVPDEISKRIGGYVSRIVHDGDTIQVGYGSMPNAILASLRDKKDLGVHSELLTDGIINLIKLGVVNNVKKTVDCGKAIASFCMGTRETYEFINENPRIEFRTIDYTNSQYIISSQRNMTAINSALQIDLTGQATAESIGTIFYSGVGGQVDFMRGSLHSPGGKSILTMRSTSNDGRYSRIVPTFDRGAGTTLVRGDIHYVITEYGIAYLHAKNIRERAMSLIAIAHPEFRPWLIEEAKDLGYIYRDQAFVPGRAGEYPEHLEAYKITKTGLPLLLRPVKISDEDLLKDFFYSLSDKSIYRRFFSSRTYMPHKFLQQFVVIDYTKQMTILAVIEKDEIEIIVGIGQYIIIEKAHKADVAFAVRDEYQNNGIGTLLLTYLMSIAMKEGLLGFTADVLAENRAMLHLFDKMDFEMEKTIDAGTYEINMGFKNKSV